MNYFVENLNWSSYIGDDFLAIGLLVSRPKFPGTEKRVQSSNQSNSSAKRVCQKLSSSVVSKRSRKGLYNNHGISLGRYGSVINHMYSILSLGETFFIMLEAKF